MLDPAARDRPYRRLYSGKAAPAILEHVAYQIHIVSGPVCESAPQLRMAAIPHIGQGVCEAWGYRWMSHNAR